MHPFTNYIYILEREESMHVHVFRGRGRGRKRERISSICPTERGAQHRAQSHDPEIITRAEIKSWVLHQPSHPGAPCFSCLQESFLRAPHISVGLKRNAIKIQMDVTSLNYSQHSFLCP